MKSVLNKRYVMLALTVAMLLLFSGCAPTSYQGMTRLHFKTIGRIPVVEGKINGIRAYFIIDTGASVSILNESKADHFGFRFSPRMNHSISGFSGRTNINQAFGCKVEVGPVPVNHVTFHTKCLKDVVNIIRQHDSIEIAGIIGSDVFDQYDITIDYKNQTISF